MDKSKNGAGTGQAAPLKTIEAWRQEKGTSRPLYVGTCIAFGWRPGKAVTEKEYEEAVAVFGGAVMGRCI